MCLSEYEEGDTLRHLKCGHDFHKDCIDQWLQVGGWGDEVGWVCKVMNLGGWMGGVMKLGGCAR